MVFQKSIQQFVASHLHFTAKTLITIYSCILICHLKTKHFEISYPSLLLQPGILCQSLFQSFFCSWLMAISFQDFLCLVPKHLASPSTSFISTIHLKTKPLPVIEIPITKSVSNFCKCSPHLHTSSGTPITVFITKNH